MNSSSNLTLLKAIVVTIALCFSSLTKADVQIVLVGDVLPHNKAETLLRAGQSPFGDFSLDLVGADVSIGNLECVISSTGKKEQKPFTFRASPRVLPGLKKHFTAMSIANNHTVDYGTSAFVDMLAKSKAAGLPLFGGGKDLIEAHAPFVIRVKNKVIAILAYNAFLPRYFEALHDQPGVAWLDEDLAYQMIYTTRKVIKPDLLIIMPHWGIEEEKRPTGRQQHLARKFIDFGADIVVGGHPHVTQGHEVYNKKLIVYSLGNFLFDEYTSNPETRKSWVLKLKLNGNNDLTWEMVNAYLDSDGIPRKQP